MTEPMIYVACDLPDDMTLAEWRRLHRVRRRSLRRRLATLGRHC